MGPSGDDPDQTLGVVRVQVETLHGVVIGWSQEVSRLSPRQLLEIPCVIVDGVQLPFGVVVVHLVLLTVTLAHLGEDLTVALHLDGLVLHPDVGVPQKGLAGVNVDLGVVGPSVSLRALAVVVIENLDTFEYKMMNISILPLPS